MGILIGVLHLLKTIFKTQLSAMNLHALFKNAMQRGKPDSVTFLTRWIGKALGNKSVTFLQIGSNDGRTRDPIFDLISKNIKWRGIFVDPVPYLFDRLKKNYLSLGHPDRFLFFNGAVNEGINQDFYFWMSTQSMSYQIYPNGTIR